MKNRSKMATCIIVGKSENKTHFSLLFPAPPVQNVDEAASEDRAVESSFSSRKFPVHDSRRVHKEYDTWHTLFAP